jgi:putative ABC transport system permease protein
MAILSTKRRVVADDQPDAADDFLTPLQSTSGVIPVWEITTIAWGSLMANKMRSLLTMLGIIIGVASVVALLSLGNGVSNQITSQVTSLGTNLLAVVPGSPNQDGPPGAGGADDVLTNSDVAAIEKLRLPVNGISPEFGSVAQLVAPVADANAQVTGVVADYATVNNVTVARGTFIVERDAEGSSPTIVLGSNLKTALFGQGEALGQTIRIKNIAVRVIGVLEEKGGIGSVDDLAFVPLGFAQQRLFGARTPDGNGWQVSSIVIAVTRTEDISAVQERIEALMRLRRELAIDGSEDNFQMFDMSSFLDTLTTITTALTAFLGAIAGISLLVGGIGIMNIMLVSVTERTREIGLRKAVGARGRDILLQFLVEAVVLSLAGGFIGLLIGAAIAYGVTLTGLLNTPVTLSSVLLALGFSTAVGVFFGFYPAQRAAKLNPIDALRHE